MAAERLTDNPPALDSNADALAGAKWYFYATETLNLQSVYTTSDLSVAHPNPVVADASGRFDPIFFNSSLTYRGILKNAEDTTIQDVDPINTGFFSILAQEDGAENITFKAEITGSKTRNLRAKAGETHVDVLDFASPSDSIADQTAGLAAMFANAPTGANLHFPNEGTYKTNSRIVSTKQFNIHGGGSQIWGLEGDPNKATLEFAVTTPSNGNGDIRRMNIENLDVLSVDVSTGSTGPAVKVSSPVGMHQTLFKNCYFNSALTTAYAVVLQSDIFAIASGDEQFSTTLENCSIFNGLHVNKLSDTFRSVRNNYFGTKRNLIDFTSGAFCALFDHDNGQATEGYLNIVGGSQIDILGTQLEGSATAGAFIEVNASTYDMQGIRFRDINFGAGDAVTRNVILKGTKNLSGVEFSSCVWGMGTGLVYDVDIQSATVRDTIFWRNQLCRNDRMATGFAPNHASYAAAEAALTGTHDATDLLLINDGGVGTRGIWKTNVTFAGAWATNEFQFMKDPSSSMVETRGGVQGGNTANGQSVLTFPEGFRPLEDANLLVLAGAASTTPARVAVNPVGVAVIVAGGADPMYFGNHMRFYAPNSRYLPGV